jgi:hypothetical protein
MKSPIAMAEPAPDRERVTRPTLSLRARGVPLASLIIAVTVGCGIGGPSGAGWRDANLHAVDGIWITGEEPCAPTSSDDLCAAIRVAALARVRADAPDASPLDTVALARLPTKWFNAHGEQILLTTGGMVHPQVAIVDLADGRRVAVGLLCQPRILSDSEPPQPATCFDGPDTLATYRVGGRGPNPFGDAP